MRPDIAAYLRNLAEEQPVLARFVDLLRSERDALIQGDADRLAALAEPKSRCLSALQAHAEERRQILAAAGQASDRNGIRAWMRSHEKSEPQLARRWREFLELARVADEANRTNGALVATRLRMTQQALATLFQAARIPGAYGADGSTVSLHTARQLAVA